MSTLESHVRLAVNALVRTRNDEGEGGPLQTVVITAGLLALAIAVVAAIVAAVNGRLGGIF